MSTAFIIGNGPTRLDINLHDLVGKGKIYGCNALYRDFDKFDYLIFFVIILLFLSSFFLLNQLFYLHQHLNHLHR